MPQRCALVERVRYLRTFLNLENRCIILHLTLHLTLHLSVLKIALPVKNRPVDQVTATCLLWGHRRLRARKNARSCAPVLLDSVRANSAVETNGDYVPAFLIQNQMLALA